MKAIHKEKNWAKMHLTDLRGVACSSGVFYKNAPLEQGTGTPYPPITWHTVCRAFSAVQRGTGQTAYPPQVFLENNAGKVVGVIWEICAKYEYGSYYDLDWLQKEAVTNLVCEVHQHLGSNYADFVIS